MARPESAKQPVRKEKHAMEEMLGRAGISLSETDYLEARDTGRVVGDSIEVNAAAATYGRGRKNERLFVTSS